MDILEAQHRKIIIILVIVILAGGGYWMLKHFHPTLFLGEPDLVVETEATPRPQPAPTPKSEVAVHVTGAVKSPGVYYLSAGARVHEAIEKAGGATNQADIHSLNLAAKIRDGQQIDVPMIRQIPDVKGDTPIPNAVQEYTIPASPAVSMPPEHSVRKPAEPSAGARININTATSQELQTLRGIGPALAQRIIEYRQISGGFSTVDDLTNVKGIGKKTLEKIRDSITVY